MKSLTTFLFIFLASSSWRCDEPEDTINCSDAAKQMIGTWTGRTDYTSSSASGTSSVFGISKGGGVGICGALNRKLIFIILLKLLFVL